MKKKYTSVNPGHEYGIAYHNPNDINDIDICRFIWEEDAQEWLHTEQYDFQIREIMSVSDAFEFINDCNTSSIETDDIIEFCLIYHANDYLAFDEGWGIPEFYECRKGDEN